jgi:hypothetical protein
MARGFINGEYEDGEIRGLSFIAGERGMGKTTEEIRLVETCGGGQVFFDTVGTHAEILKAKGFKEFNETGPLKQYVGANLGRRFRVVYVPRDEYPEKHLVAICTLVRAWGKELAKRFGDAGGLVLTVDEIDTFCGPEWGHKWMPIPLYNLAHFGRHYHVSMACAARDPKSLSKKFRSQCATMRIFRVSEEDDVSYFAARIGKANAAKLPLLEKTYYLLWQAGTVDAQIAGGPRTL